MRKFTNKQPKPKKIRVEYYVITKCNLNCKSCAVYSPLVPVNDPIPLEQIKIDFKRLYDLTYDGTRIFAITIMGGEPLLHPAINDIIIYLATTFKETQIKLWTNGLLLNKMPDEFFSIVKEYNVQLIITKYRINLNYEDISKKLNSCGVNAYFAGKDPDNGWYISQLKNKHDGDINKPCLYRRLFILKGTRVYNCTEIAFFDVFDNMFKGKHDLSVTPDDYIDLDDINSFEELMEAKEKAPPFCGNCRGDNRNKSNWDQSSKNIDEWLTPDEDI